MNKKIIIIALVILILVLAGAGVFYIFGKQKILSKGHNYRNPNIPSYLIKDYASPEYKIGGLPNLDNDYLYSTKEGQIACKDVSKKIEKVEYFSFSPGGGVIGGWGSAAAYICGDYYVIEDCNDAWGCIVYGVFKKDSGYQANILQKFVKDQLSQQTTPISTADAFYGYKKSFNPGVPNETSFNINMKLFLSSKTWTCLNDRYNNNLKNSVFEISNVSAGKCGLTYSDFGEPEITFAIKAQTPTLANIAVKRGEIEEYNYNLIFENGYWRVDSTILCGVLSNPCGIKNFKQRVF